MAETNLWYLRIKSLELTSYLHQPSDAGGVLKPV